MNLNQKIKSQSLIGNVIHGRIKSWAKETATIMSQSLIGNVIQKYH